MSMTAITVNQRQQPPPANQQANGTSTGMYLALGSMRATIKPAGGTLQTRVCVTYASPGDEKQQADICDASTSLMDTISAHL